MHLTTYVENLTQAKSLVELGYRDFILAPAVLSKQGLLKISDVQECFDYLKAQEIEPILEWDVIQTPKRFDKNMLFFVKLFATCPFTRVRVQDPGVVEFFKTIHPSIKIQLNLESGNRNLVGLLKWQDYLGSQLERMILSIELSKDILEKQIKNLQVDVEILGLGQILLFYTPRALLSSIYEVEAGDDFYLQAQGESEESPHKGFPLYENQHGTFMYHLKDICLLEKYPELRQMGLKYLRVDVRHVSEKNLLAALSKFHQSGDEQDLQNLIDSYPRDTLRGFYHVNKTDVLFPKLKNSRLLKNDDLYVGEVCEVEKGSYIVVHLKGKWGLEVGSKVEFINPDGEKFCADITSLSSAQGENQKSLGAGRIAMINYVKKVTPKTVVNRYMGVV